MLRVCVYIYNTDVFACVRYYQDIKTMPAISDQDMNAMLADESRVCQSVCYSFIHSLVYYYAKAA